MLISVYYILHVYLPQKKKIIVKWYKDNNTVEMELAILCYGEENHATLVRHRAQ